MPSKKKMTNGNANPGAQKDTKIEDKPEKPIEIHKEDSNSNENAAAGPSASTPITIPAIPSTTAAEPPTSPKVDPTSPLNGPSSPQSLKDEPRSPPLTAGSMVAGGVGGSDGTPRSSVDAGEERTLTLEAELSMVRQEKDVLANQYRGLLQKLTAMRQSLGEKLQADAEELDRRESQITTLSNDNSSLQNTITTLQHELTSANQESTNLQAQLAQLRSQSDSSSSDVLSLTREMRELRGEMERLRMEREEWEGEANKERGRREGMEDEMRSMERSTREAVSLAERSKEEMVGERERARNLQEVLSEFQSAKDSEIREATRDLEKQLTQAAASLSEYKLRAANAEAQVAEDGADVKRSKALEKELREKNQLISKLRHEAVVNNEHLTVALRRLRKNTSDNNVDRRLVTNILLSFLSTSRADSKRFEMLNLLSTILQWDDREREKAGLQRMAVNTSSGGAGGKGTSPSQPKVKRMDSESERTAEEEAAMNESFSNLFVEFLLKEASQGQPLKPEGVDNLPSPSPLSPLRSPSYASSTISPPGTGSSTPMGGFFQHRASSMSSMSNSQGGVTSPPERPKLGLPVLSRKGSHTLVNALEREKGT